MGVCPFTSTGTKRACGEVREWMMEERRRGGGEEGGGIGGHDNVDATHVRNRHTFACVLREPKAAASSTRY